MNPGYQNTGTEKFIEAFDAFSITHGKGNSELNEMAIGRFKELGFPTTKHEEWKYTNVAPILKNTFSFSAQVFRLTKEDIQACLLTGKESIVLVFENGNLNKELSVLDGIPQGVIVDSLAVNRNHEQVKKHLGQYAPMKQESFVALNTAFVLDGAFIFIPANTVIEKPIHLLYINDSRAQSTVVYPRNLIIAEKSSSVKIASSYHTLGSVNAAFTNCVSEIVTGSNANVEFIKIQNENNSTYHISHTEAVQARDSVFNISTITLGGAIVRNNLHIVLNDVNSTAHLYGLYITDGNQLVDNHTLVDHAKPNCESNELYKGVLGGKSQGVFNGKVFVRQDAQKTNAYQSNKNILLSDEATMNTKPQLEIFADDVKCSHGATTGQLDAEALFYLRSRGIGENAAKAFLNIAFAADVIKNISIENLRDRLMPLIESKLQQGN